MIKHTYYVTYVPENETKSRRIGCNSLDFCYDHIKYSGYKYACIEIYKGDECLVLKFNDCQIVDWDIVKGTVEQ